jgi:hypothetical protein
MTTMAAVASGDPDRMVRVSHSSLITAFSPQTIGTKVIDHKGFRREMCRAVYDHDFSRDRIPGQALIEVPRAIPFVSSGVGKHIDEPEAYVLRSHRGKVHMYLHREFAAPVDRCAIVAYTMAAYLDDPDIEETPGEADRILDEDPTHVLVAILAYSGNQTALSPYRFVKNLAGGNHEALAWTADEIRAKACEIANYTDTWSVVAD